MLTGSWVAIAILVLTHLGVMPALENAYYRWLFHLQEPLPWDDRSVLIAINDATLMELGPFLLNHGALMQAGVLDNILQQRYLHLIAPTWLWLLLLLAMPVVSYILVGQSLRAQLLITGGSVASCLGLSLALFAGNYWWPTATPMLLLGLTGMASIAGQRLQENLALKQLLEDLWQYYRHKIVLLPNRSTAAASMPAVLGGEVRKLALLADFLGRVQATQAAIAQTMPVGIVAVDAQDQVWFCNPLANQWLGLSVGDHLTPALVPQWLDEPTWQAIRQALLGGKAVTSIERQQELMWFELRFEPLEDVDYPSPLLCQAQHSFVLLLEDITHRKAIELPLRLFNQGPESDAQKRARELELANLDLQREILERCQVQEKLVYQALHDELTGLPNRYHLVTRLTELLEQTEPPPTPQFAVLFLDCDRFKLVNDSFGHLVGDALLKAIAKRLRNCVAQKDIVARFGGDEFIVVLTELPTLESAIQVAKRIRQRLQEPFFLQNCQLNTGCSIGIVINEPSYSQSEAILRDADTAMYRAKQGGLGYAIFEPQMHLQISSSFQFETDLRQALRRQELLVHYQPIFSIETQNIEGFEALVRWQHPAQGLVLPDQFIPIAEETGLILPIGQWVLKQACTQLRLWQQQYQLKVGTFMSVNLSVRQFSEVNLLTHIDETLQETGLASQCLKLEITESAIMTNTELALKTCNQLKERGIRLSIDDFGTGYSSLSYLHRFPIDVLKIDHSFIQRIADDHQYLRLVQAINTLANHFEIKTIAEGIENTMQLQYLKAMNDCFGQGYLFCPPVDYRTLETNYFTPQC